MSQKQQLRALVLYHLPGEGARFLKTIMRGNGIRTEEILLDEGCAIPAVEGFDLLLVMGGPQQVWEQEQHSWLQDELALIRHWVLDLQRPYFGICLGHQLLAEATGGRVAPGEFYEIGFPEVELNEAGQCHPVFAGLPQRTRWLQWHSAEVVEMPPGFELVASSTRCRNQAMAFGNRVVSLQFHAEAEQSQVDGWTSHAGALEEMRELDGADAPQRLQEQTAAHLSVAQQNTASLFQRWLDLNCAPCK